MADIFARPPARPLSVLGVAIVAGTVAIDQAAKFVVEQSLPIGVQIDVLPILALYRVNNAGIAFSLLRDFGGVGLIVLTLAITVIVLGFWWRAADGGRVAAIGYAFIVGGALGNLVDRLRLGHVVDFLLLHLGNWTLFVFNPADAALTFGPIFLLIAYAWPRERTAPD
jgi:signal peptidase II